MPVVALVSSKGGAGASLIAANMACALAGLESCLLIDLNSIGGCDDLLLGIESRRSWADLLHVADELSPTHIEKAAAKHTSGLVFLSAFNGPVGRVHPHQLRQLIVSLAGHFSWVVCDAQSGWNALSVGALRASERSLLVTTPDPPALRNAHRFVQLIPDDVLQKTGLVINQMSDRHPVDASAVAHSLEINLAGCISADPQGVRDQIYFGDRASGRFSTAVEMLVEEVADQRLLVDSP